MPADLVKARAAAQKVYAARDGLHARLDALADAIPPVEYSVELATADIEALTFWVVMQAAESAQEDLKAVMAKVKAVTEAKRKWRRAVGLKPEPCKDCLDADVAFALLAGIVERELDELKDDLDSLSDVDEEMQLRLQMYMDRMTKLMSTLSNLLKKLSDTSNQIVQNLK